MTADLNPKEAEDVVIGQILYEPGCISRAIRCLKAEHFFNAPHRTVFEHAHGLWRAGTPVDLVTMHDALRSSGKLESIGGPYQLSQWTNRIAQTIHLEAHCEIIRREYGLRTLRQASLDVAQGTRSGVDPNELLSQWNVESAKASMADMDTDVNAGEMAYQMMNEVNTEKPFRFGMIGVDDYVFFLPGNVITVSAPSGVGKSAFCLCAVLNLLPRLKPWIVSLEMPAKEVIMRTLCQFAKVDIDLAMADQLHPNDRERLGHAASEHAEVLSGIDIDDSGQMDIDTFMAKAEHKVKNEGVKWIMIDYAQLMDADRKIYPNEALQNEAISKGIRATARKLNIPILLIVHLNRQGEAHGSTQYEKDAHIRIKLSRDPAGKTMEVDVIKNRNGRTATITTPCEMRWGIIGRTA